MQVVDQLQQIKEIINRAERITLLTHPKCSVDTVPSLLVLKRLMEARGKKVDLYVPQFVPAPDLAELDLSEVKSELPVRQTTVKIGLNEGGLKKISYETKGQELFLYLIPRQGVINANQVEIFSNKLETDVVITLGLRNATSLPDWPPNWYEELEQDQTLINIDRDIQNAQYGTINYIDGNVPSLVQLTIELVEKLGWGIAPVEAKILLLGVRRLTQNYTQSLTAGVFALSGRLWQIIEDGEKIDDSQVSDKLISSEGGS